MNQQIVNRLMFSHLIELPNSHCTFCFTRERESGRLWLFLIFEKMERIYQRNALNGTWLELTDEQQCQAFRDQFRDSILKRNIPCFTTENMEPQLC